LELLEPSHGELSVRQQSDLLDIPRSTVYYSPIGYSTEEISIFHEIDSIYTQYPFYGYRRIWQELLGTGFDIGRDRVLKYMQVMGIQAVFPGKRTTIPNEENKIYPYLLRGLKIDRPNLVWSTDITYVRMQNSFCYLVAVIDWFSRALLSFRLSNSMTVDFCIEALKEALSKYPNPEIFNTDQGSQFTSQEFTGVLSSESIKISMDGKGRATDNIMIERFWRSIKYENIFLQGYTTIKEARDGINSYIDFYNQKRRHSSLNYKTPFSVYFQR
jgi:putative transposase